jgi:Tol biopolymer transport system component
MRPRFSQFCLFLLLLAAVAGAQPSVDIHLLEFHRGDDGELSFGTITNFTQRPGYDNQPAFLPDGSGILYTSMRDTLQSDIYRYDIATAEVHRVTDTPESEYSPTPIADGARFSTVRVEMDESQRLWDLDMSGGNATLVLPDVKPVGYHAWAPDERLALFVLGEPHELHLAQRGPGASTLSCKDIGRSLQLMPDGKRISFLQRRVQGEAESWWIRSVDPVDGSLADLVEAPEGAQDHAWSPWGSIFMTAESRLLEWDPAGGDWQIRADFSGQGLNGLTRLAFHPGHNLMALVAAEAEEASEGAEE